MGGGLVGACRSSVAGRKTVCTSGSPQMCTKIFPSVGALNSEKPFAFPSKPAFQNFGDFRRHSLPTTCIHAKRLNTDRFSRSFQLRRRENRAPNRQRPGNRRSDHAFRWKRKRHVTGRNRRRRRRASRASLERRPRPWRRTFRLRPSRKCTGIRRGELSDKGSGIHSSRGTRDVHECRQPLRYFR